MAFENKLWIDVPDPNNLPSVPEHQDSLARFDAANMNRIEGGIVANEKNIISTVNEAIDRINAVIDSINQSDMAIIRNTQGEEMYDTKTKSFSKSNINTSGYTELDSGGERIFENFEIGTFYFDLKEPQHVSLSASMNLTITNLNHNSILGGYGYNKVTLKAEEEGKVISVSYNLKNYENSCNIINFTFETEDYEYIKKNNPEFKILIDWKVYCKTTAAKYNFNQVSASGELSYKATRHIELEKIAHIE